MDHTLPYLVNCSLMFTEEPLLRRPAAAKAAGFSAVEFWWPFATPVPSDREVDAFVAAVSEADVALVGLNFFAGDLAGPDCGVLSIPGRSSQFRDNVDVTVGIGERLGVRGFNALYGNRVDGVDPVAQDELATENITLAAKAAAGIGATVLIEPVSGPKPYPLRTADDAVAVVRRARAAGAANVGFLCDVYHLASNGDDVDAAVAAHAGVTAHVQIADAPGRGEPGSGQLDLDRYLAALEDHGYRGWVSLEYKPTSTTEASLAWLPGCAAQERSRHDHSDPPEPKGRGAAWTEERSDEGRRRLKSAPEATGKTPDRVYRAGDHGRADGGQPGQGRLRRHRLQPEPGPGSSSSWRPEVAAPRTSPKRSATRTWWPRWCPTPPTSGRCWPARAACSSTRGPAR